MSLLAWVLMLCSCRLSAAGAGLVVPHDQHFDLTHPQGSQRHLIWREVYPLEGFQDLTLQVQGPSLGRWIWVQDWTLLADRSGWTPFVGPLRVEGVQVFLEDRATGSVLILEGPAAQILRSGDGELALVTGYVSGAHRIQVLEARILDRPAEP